MRSILILIILGALLLLPGMSSAETSAECKARCAAEKESRDINCPPADADSDQARVQCLQESQNTFDGCLNGCPQAEPEDTQKEN